MTIVPVASLCPDEINHLGDNLAQAIRDDHEELAQHRSLTGLGEDDVELLPPEGRA